jgi:formylglycine-generating enzyme
MKNIFRFSGILTCMIIVFNITYSQRNNKTGTNSSQSDMVLIESGYFEMGQAEGNMIQKGMSRGEFPTHNVDLNGYYIGEYEVTQRQWRDIMNNSPGKFKDCDNCPVECVSWWSAVKYCNYRSIKEGLTPCYTYNGETNPEKWTIQKYDNKKIKCDITAKGYRLPTEAEWEYASRGGSESKNYRYSGSDKVDDVAWYKGNSDRKTHPVGEKSPNELGIYDMSGNVREWCNDWYDENYYSKSPKSNPMGQDTGQYRVLRGGSWLDFKYTLTVTQRLNSLPENREGFGFRVARSE